MGKYTYLTLFEEAEKHGVSKEEYSRESSKLTIMTWIANELAEANRLKRIEITILGANLDIPKTFSEAREDRA